VSNRARVIVRTALAIAAALLAARLWFLAHRALDLDEYEHAHAAWSVARGLLPYRDFFEHHPPAAYLLFARLFASPAIATDAPAAIRALMLARAAMWLTTLVSFAIVYRLGILARGRLAAAFAVVLLATSSQFLESMLEFRPDVPAVCCLLAAIWGMSAPDDGPRSRARLFVAGVAFGGSLLFTQKTIFAAPGLLLALLATRRVAPPALVAAGALTPIAVTMWWFDRHGALATFWYYTVVFNGRLNADGFSPFPRMVSSVIQQPAIYALGIVGMAVRLKPDTTRATTDAAVVSGFSRTVILCTAISLIAGIFIIARAYDQYYALLLPLLAVLGGAAASDLFERAQRHASLVCRGAMLALAALSLAMSARAFTPIDPQIDEIAFVAAQTRPSDTYVGGTPGAALFRPNGWFYFFLTGAFATEREYTDLLSDLETGRLRPRVVVRDRYLEQRAPAPLLAYIAAHYRHARGELYLRQSEYGSSALNSSEASERLDRPFTR
jgi:4-amino-4-deoxy-L-arabinose transferase-like glycosyltransferase